MKSTRKCTSLNVGLALALALTLVLGTEWILPARAASVNVTTTDDVLDAAGGCGAVTVASLPGPDGITSLREAMCAANNNAGPDTIRFAIPGCGSGCTIEPTIALPTLTDEDTTIDGYSQDGAAPATDTAPAKLLIELDGSSIATQNGLNISSGGNVIRGLVINRFPGNGVAIGGSAAINNVIAGNYIGTDPSGSSALGNGYNGVFIGLGAQNNTVGGDEPSERNVISGNVLEGVGIHGIETGSNAVSGNYIGTDATGTTSVGNELHGVRIYGGSRNNTVGGSTSGERNVISGNAEEGIRIVGMGTTGNAISGNYIGLDASGLATVPNVSHGIMIQGGDNSVGGETAAEANFIAGNEYGIWIEGAAATRNWIRGNVIGVSIEFDPLGNTHDGVRISFDATDNTIGPDNIIAYNGDDGVGVDTPTAMGNTITQNHIVANEGLGINLTNGAHSGIAAPIISSAPSGPGDITGTARPGSTVEVFVNRDDDGEGLVHVGSAVAWGDGTFTVSVDFLPFPYLTATATDPDDGTSEFSAVFTAEIPVLQEESEKSVDREMASPGEVLTYTLTVANTGTAEATVTLTDTLPPEVSFTGGASHSSGRLRWDRENNRLVWDGTVGLSVPVTIAYRVRLEAGLANGETISNDALVDNGAGYVFGIIAPDVTVVAHYVYLPLIVRSE